MRWILAIPFVMSCSVGTPSAVPDGAPACVPPTTGTAPTYSQLFTSYFAPNTPGHCATAHCHADPGHNEWLCGKTADSCYAGMVTVGLIDPARPAASMIGDPRLSPLSWINPTG